MKKKDVNLLKWRNLFGFLFAMLLVSSCINTGDNVNPGNNNGQFRLLMTDDPLLIQNISQVTITIDKITLHKKGMEENDSTAENDSTEADEHTGDHHDCNCHDEDSSAWVTILDTPMEINLMDLRNGITSILADTSIESGTYDMIRLYISDAKLELTDGTMFTLNIPGGSESGLKIFIPSGIVVDGGLNSELLLDFDLDRSLVVLGSINDPNGFNLVPVIRAEDNSSCGKIEGHVMDSTMAAVKGAYVWLKDDSVISSTTSEESGFYRMIGIPEGTYTLYASMQGYDTTKVEDVHVSGRSNTRVDIELLP